MYPIHQFAERRAYTYPESLLQRRLSWRLLHHQTATVMYHHERMSGGTSVSHRSKYSSTGPVFPLCVQVPQHVGLVLGVFVTSILAIPL